MLPRSSAARVGSQQIVGLTVPPPSEVRRSDELGIVRMTSLPGCIELFEIQTSGFPVSGLTLAATRAELSGSTAA